MSRHQYKSELWPKAREQVEKALQAVLAFPGLTAAYQEDSPCRKILVREGNKITAVGFMEPNHRGLGYRYIVTIGGDTYFERKRQSRFIWDENATQREHLAKAKRILARITKRLEECRIAAKQDEEREAAEAEGKRARAISQMLCDELKEGAPQQLEFHSTSYKDRVEVYLKIYAGRDKAEAIKKALHGILA